MKMDFISEYNKIVVTEDGFKILCASERVVEEFEWEPVDE